MASCIFRQHMSIAVATSSLALCRARCGGWLLRGAADVAVAAAAAAAATAGCWLAAGHNRS